MAIELTVEYADTEDPHGPEARRCTVTLALRVGARPVAPERSAPGRAVFRLSECAPGDVCTLAVRVDAPAAWSHPEPLLRFEQPLRVAGDAASPTLVAAPTERWRDQLHPRIVALGPPAQPLARPLHAAPNGTLRVVTARHPITLRLDLDFIDVTELVRSRPALPDEQDNMAHYEHGITSVGGVPPHYGAELRLLYQRSCSPPLWAVVVPPAARAAQHPAALVYYRPQGQAYSGPRDAELGPLWRYLLDPPKGHPFYTGVVEGETALVQNPAMGLERQLVQSGRSAVLVHPVPVEADFGDAGGRRMLPALDGIYRALWADGHAGQGHTQGVRRGKLAIAAFSFGGRPALEALAQVPQAIDEAYLFDCNTFDTREAAIMAWFQRGGRRLRMVGGKNQHAAMLGFLPRLPARTGEGEGGGAASVWPASESYWHTDALYQEVFLAPRGGIDGFTPASAGAASSALSRATGLFLASPPRSTTLRLQARRADGVVLGEADLPGCTEGVTALAVWFHRVRGHEGAPRRIRSVQDIESIADLARRDGLEWRHQWPACGGEGPADRGPGFKGYLQMCLEQSGL